MKAGARVRPAGALALLAAAGCATAPPPPATAPPPAASPPIAAPPAPAPAPADFGLTGPMTQGGLLMGMVPQGTTALTLDGRPVPFAADGRFLIGFGRDAKPDAVVEARTGDGRALRLTLRISPRAWDIQSLPTLPKGTPETPEFQRRRAAELARIGAARAIRSDSQGWRQRFAWPATGRISGVFGSQRVYAGEAGAPHNGVDIARPTGTPVTAPADGVVILAADAPFTLEGNLLMIDHGMGLNSAMLHLSRIDVREGDHVKQGQVIGAVGMTGRATGPHLHWAMKWLDERIDAQLLVPPMPGGESR